jgi:hypothetical protein
MSTVINIAPSSGITVGTTAVTSGTNGRVFFQAGGVVQQDANFTYDNTLKRLGLKAVGTAATDIPLQVLNSSGTVTNFKIQGNETIVFQSGSFATCTFVQDFNQAATLMLRTTGNSQAELGNDFNAAPGSTYTGALKLYNWSSALRTRIQAVGTSFWADSSSQVVIGSSTAGARLDVRAQGALSTDIAFRVRNSADTANLVSIQGDGVLNLAHLADGSRIAINTTTSGQNSVSIGSGNSGLRTVSVGYTNVANGQNGVVIGSNNSAVSSGSCGIVVGYNNTHTIGIVLGTSNSGSASTVIGNNNAIGGAGATNNNMFVFGRGMTETSGDAKLPHTFMFGSYATTGNKSGLTFKSDNKNHLLLGYDIMDTSYSSGNGTNWLGVKSGIAPNGAVDAFQVYSADITAGNAAPHFRTEVGDVIKLYKQSSAGIATVGDLVTILTNLGLLG